MIESGLVVVGGAPATKAARLVDPAEAVAVLAPPARFVSRGGEKLDAALERFDLDVAGWRCLDAGASTGGFTDCLLQRGAARVVAVDVGHGQLHERVRTDGRVEVLERTNVRTVGPDRTGGPVRGVVADLSFISLRTVLPALLGLTEPDGHLVLLVKPQFEAGREAVSRGRGVITDPTIWEAALAGVVAAVRSGGGAIMGAMVSPLRGAEGNVEFLVHAVPIAPALVPVLDLTALVDGVSGGAEGDPR